MAPADDRRWYGTACPHCGLSNSVHRSDQEEVRFACHGCGSAIRSGPPAPTQLELDCAALTRCLELPVMKRIDAAAAAALLADAFDGVVVTGRGCQGYEVVG